MEKVKNFGGGHGLKFFLKVNVVSILYALILFIPLELIMNVYRISRLTTWDIGNVNILIGCTAIVLLVSGTILLFFLTKKWMGFRKAQFWTVILWAPYFVLFVYMGASLIPVTYGGDMPNPATGLLAVGALIVYPIYILIINFSSYIDKEGC
ncbi:hypothetical protein ACQKL5_13125 [Peribacillus sp. NPDC097675]|uniref:hypothetical protein n=1 Tax=Peribacillus sp. NPDC097675 TaxID=3390618 RepID=UPI003D0135CA